MKALVGAFNQEKALVGAFSVLVQPFVEPMEHYTALAWSQEAAPGSVQVHVQVLTKDSVTVSVDAVVYYRVSNATISVANVEDAHSSTRSAENLSAKNIS